MVVSGQRYSQRNVKGYFYMQITPFFRYNYDESGPHFFGSFAWSFFLYFWAGLFFQVRKRPMVFFCMVFFLYGLFFNPHPGYYSLIISKKGIFLNIKLIQYLGSNTMLGIMPKH